MHYFKSDKIDYKFNFIKLKNNLFLDFNCKQYFGDTCYHSINGYLLIEDKQIIWKQDDPVIFTPEAKNYIERVLKLLVFA